METLIVILAFVSLFTPARILGCMFFGWCVGGCFGCFIGFILGALWSGSAGD